MPLAGGLMQGYQCGQLWGAALAAGAQAYRRFGPGPRAEAAAVNAAQRLVAVFRERYRFTDCFELTEGVWKNPNLRKVMKLFLKGGPARCFGMAGSYAPAAYRTIEATLAVEPVEAPDGPASCAALFARQIGLSALQQTMVAGFAGGIGLSGGACGILGAAIWSLGLDHSGDPDTKASLVDPRVSALTEQFLESADYEFECAKITGRRFESVADHAAYLRAGGCAKIIAAVAAQGS